MRSCHVMDRFSPWTGISLLSTLGLSVHYRDRVNHVLLVRHSTQTQSVTSCPHSSPPRRNSRRPTGRPLSSPPHRAQRASAPTFSPCAAHRKLPRSHQSRRERPRLSARQRSRSASRCRSRRRTRSRRPRSRSTVLEGPESRTAVLCRQSCTISFARPRRDRKSVV